MLKRIFFIFLFLFIIFQCSYPELEDYMPPVTVVIYPYEGAVVSDNVDVLIGATDDSEVEKVWYYLDGVKIGETKKSPYTIPLDISSLEKKVNHVIQAAAKDKSDNTGYSPLVNFTVAETQDIIDPVISIVNPQSGQVVEGIVNVVAYAEDERSIQKVAFFIDGDSMEVTYSYPYSYSWDTSSYSDSTEHTIFGKAFDGGNNTAISPVVSVTVYPRTGPAGDDLPPHVLILYPIAGSTVTGVVKVSVDLQDNVGVSSAEFYVDGVLTEIASNPGSPWRFDWDTSSKADSLSHTIYVKAYDSAGNIGTSGLMTVIIQ